MNSVSAVLAGIEAELGWVRDTYKNLHRHPELSLEEHQTAKLVTDRLLAFGYEVTRIGGTGVVGVLASGEDPQSWRGRTWTPCRSRKPPGCPTPRKWKA